MKRERLTTERTKRKKNRSEVALDLGISEVYVRSLENGNVKPGRDTMLKFERYYKVSSKKLFPDIFFNHDDKKFIKTGTE
ncbi:helix-turn-helix domain-containing protein [Gorillibacterium sp. sgz5001074]|uniref:helix-turn-helix domain-containing protein n=1 Tax=Gorillibacterium sp. sgz5001074 TaxID=3446695 RepID=UPI003F676B7A